MTTPFDPGYFEPPFDALCREFPGADVYPPADFRVEWGPVFHRGRLDGSARVLLVGQDPATAEIVTRRILVGAAGQRVQGLLARLGVGARYVMVNTFLYGVYGQGGGERHRGDPAIAAYRERWLDAILAPGRIEAVIALGGLAADAWTDYRGRAGKEAAAALPFEHLRHPTWPESSSSGDAARLAASTRALLENWNAALARLAPKLGAPVRKYGTGWKQGDLAPIPADDLPPGLPPWMRSLAAWAKRSGTSAAEKRATLVVKVPRDAVEPAVAAAAAAAEARVKAAPAGAPQERPPPDPDAVERLAAGRHPESGEEGRAVVARALRRYGLRGRVVTMVDGEKVEDGVVWVDGDAIVAVQRKNDPAPAAFEGVTPLDTKGFIYPGFVDLHNHLAYNLLSLWQVPAAYDNRDDWKDEATYDQLVKRPLSILRDNPETLAAVCRYAECKSLFGGVTTTQGIRLAKANQARSYFRGIVRNVEMPDHGALPAGESRMADVEAKDVDLFWRNLQRWDGRKAAFLLHLCEGYDPKAHEHFAALQRDGGWAIDRALAGIHCVALDADDLAILRDNGGSVVWSPMSNLLLYGRTADVAAARKAGLRIGLGCDWSPSGSKNLLAEMKVAWLYRDPRTNRRVFTAREVVAMVTRVAAEIVRWDGRLGTVAKEGIADLTVLAKRRSDPYENAVRAGEADVSLVVVGGVPRYGHPDLMHELVTPDQDVEDVLVAGVPRTIDLESDDERVPRIPFSRAQAILANALQRLPELERRAPAALLRPVAARPAAGWTLALDEIEPTGEVLRTAFTRRYPHGGPPARAVPAAGKKLPTVAVPLDPPTIADHPGYLDLLSAQRNLPAYVKKELRRLYGGAAPARRRAPGRPRRRKPPRGARRRRRAA